MWKYLAATACSIAPSDLRSLSIWVVVVMLFILLYSVVQNRNPDLECVREVIVVGKFKNTYECAEWNVRKHTNAQH